MAPKRPSPLDEPPAASSSGGEEVSSEEEEGEEEESGSGSDSEPEEPLPPKTSSSAPVAEKKPPPKKPDSSAANSKPQFSSSGSEDDSGSDVDKDLVVKPIASKPMEETPKTKRPRSKPAATATPAAKSGSKRPSETEPKDSKRPKKKGAAVEQEPDQVIILKGMVDYTTKKGADPYSDMGAFHDFIKKSLKVDVNKSQLQAKIRRLKKKYATNVKKKKYNLTKAHDQKVFDLSKKVWGGSGEGSSGVNEPSEQPKSNGKARNTKTLASIKADILSSPERSKEATKVDLGLNPCSSEGLSEVIGFDKCFRELGLPEGVVKQGLELIGESKRADLKEKWRKLHVAELELFVKRSELMRDQTKVILEALKSSGH
ncbi:mediator-associated protein 1-like [Pyrus ussuriensis x Pyrus communis]|uniref:Mediator-associated protein 1-like n=1 Tax=Pyrus ussuriensis x Pyrus communis TaxID=2448454 RepID=A0A5N5IBI2_9ROSA|nr:mediator-associated protein 1-like [Pyrus ussuriensis x Pyrus communis]